MADQRAPRRSGSYDRQEEGQGARQQPWRDDPRNDRPRDARPSDTRPGDTRPDQRDDQPRDERARYERGGYSQGGYGQRPSRRDGYDQGGYDRDGSDRANYGRGRYDQARDQDRDQAGYGQRDSRYAGQDPRDGRGGGTSGGYGGGYGDGYGETYGYGAPAERDPLPLPPRDPDPDRICGPAAVEALFSTRSDDVVRLFYTTARRYLAGPFCKRLAQNRRVYREVPPEELTRIAGTPHHGGIVAIALPRRVLVLDLESPPAILFAAPVLLVLDGIGNPHNLGAIARSAAFFGCKALLLSGDSRQGGLSDAVWRTSEGGIEHLALYWTEDLPAALAALAPRLPAVAAVARGGEPPAALPPARPVALVMGNEEHGLSSATIAACRYRVTLPGEVAVESLNVSAATAVLLYGLLQAA